MQTDLPPIDPEATSAATESREKIKKRWCEQLQIPRQRVQLSFRVRVREFSNAFDLQLVETRGNQSVRCVNALIVFAHLYWDLGEIEAVQRGALMQGCGIASSFFNSLAVG